MLNITRTEYREYGNSTIAVTVEGETTNVIAARFECYYGNGNTSFNMIIADEAAYAANMATVDGEFASFKTHCLAVITAIKSV